MSLIEASNTDNKPRVEDLIVIFEDIKDIKKRNILTVKVYKEGYSQHMIAKVLGMHNQRLTE